ncbi:hypothetical protein G7Z17_g13463 [Cylindrodendrum hubeiense]|uniref:Rubisco LSMT substrate-binding domain-containing protein n=1 Tax=Cylindrodendrum hubeiense TaxID=595255 RepID=A0A9P5GYV6_9HYPO|nr:hypothetical protein G7Z17_g13463 [Cylindrodendrum hubeiense]
MTEEVRWELDEGRASCDLRVAKAYQPGEQVFNNYSIKTNAELLLGYGFMLPETDALHNDYVHLPARADQAAAQLSASASVLGAFQHVQTDMVWDIFCTLAPPEQQAQLVPVAAGLQGDAAEQARRDAFFGGRVSEEGTAFLQQTAAIIQHKVMQELERLDETDVEVVGGGDLTRNQQLALDYRARCRRVLENTLEAMDADGLFGQGEDEQ